MEIYEFDELNDLCWFLNCIPNIHWGGCGFAALAMYDCLLRNGHSDAEILFVYKERSEWAYNINVRALSNGFDELTACTHVLVSVGGCYIDCTGEKVLSFYKHSHTISRELLVEVLKKVDVWNADFVRSVQVPRIEKYIGYKFW